MSDLSKNNKSIKVKSLKEYLKGHPDQNIAKTYISLLENYDDEEFVPDSVLYDLGFSVDFLKIIKEED